MKIFEHTELWLPAVKRTDPMLTRIIEPYAFVLGLWKEPKIDIEEMEKIFWETCTILKIESKSSSTKPLFYH